MRAYALPSRSHHRAQTGTRDSPNAGSSPRCVIKTGDAGGLRYCPQAARYHTGVDNEALMSLDEVLAAARRAQESGATRFCMGAAWRGPKQRDLERVVEMVKAVRGLGMETCATLGMLKPGQAEQLRAAGLDYYNHKSHRAGVLRRDHQHPHPGQQARHARPGGDSGLHVCCGASRMGDRGARAQRHRAAFANMTRIRIGADNTSAGRRHAIARAEALDPFEFVRTIACARITMPKAMCACLQGARRCRGDQALCFLAVRTRSSTAKSCSQPAKSEAEKDRACSTASGCGRWSSSVTPESSAPRELQPAPVSLNGALAADLAVLESRGLRRHRRVLQSPQRARFTVDGRDYVAFCSNDYLATRRASRPRRAPAQARERTASARVLRTWSSAYTRASRAREALAVFVKAASCGLFFDGYMANLGLVTAWPDARPRYSPTS